MNLGIGELLVKTETTLTSLPREKELLRYVYSNPRWCVCFLCY